MESTREQSGALQQILPPRLEDAGLEDPALPPESIHEAFLKAAAAVKSGASSIFSFTTDCEDDDHGCVHDPWPTGKDAFGIESENEPPGSCIVERGFEVVPDEVKVAGGDGGGAEDVVVEKEAKLGEDKKPCVDELQGLNINDVKKSGVVGEDDDGKNKKPTLVEGFA